VRLGILTDIHHAPHDTAPDGWHNQHQFDTVLTRLAQSIRWLESQGVERLAVLGDLTHHGDDASMREVLAAIAQAKVPAWILPGNHDLQPDLTILTAAIDTLGSDILARLNGTPATLAHDWLVTGLDLERTAPGAYQATPAPDPAAWGNSPVLVLSHFPILTLKPHAKEAGLKYAGDLANAESIGAALLERTAPTLVINGHLHIRHAVTQGSVLQASCGAQVESLFEATVVDFGAWNEGRISWVSSAIQPVDPGVSPVLSEPEQAWQWDGTAWRS
jgi:predicted phosphodiesterase